MMPAHFDTPEARQFLLLPYPVRIVLAALPALILVLLITPAAASDVGIERPFLWVVEQPHTPAAKTSYLFGTIHSAHPKLNKLPASVTGAFDRADAFYGELALDPQTLLAATLGFSSNEPGAMLQPLTLTQRQRATQVLQGIHPGLSLDAFTNMKLWAFVATLSLLEDQVRYSNAPAMDMRLYNEALQAGKEAGGLETIDEQIAVFESFSEAEVLQMLDATLDYMEATQAAGQSTMAETYAAYQSGDTRRFEQLMDEQMPLSAELAAKLDQRLLSDRNQTMSERIAKLLRERPGDSFFFAVGAAHFSGSESIQRLLREQGFAVSRVTP